MFCAGCGTQIQSGLNYCSRCGRRVAENESGSDAIAKSMASSLGYIGGFGFLSYVFVIGVLVKFAAPSNLLVPITFFYFAALFGICFLIINQTQAFRKNKARLDESRFPEERAYLHPATTAQLPEQRDSGIGSVVDETTRTLDKVPRRETP